MSVVPNLSKLPKIIKLYGWLEGRKERVEGPPPMLAKPLEVRRGGRLPALVSRRPPRKFSGVDTVFGGVPVRMYGPKTREPIPAVVALHGGGWALGTPLQIDGLSGRLASRARVRVVSVDYRLAPEHPYPAALNDSVAVVRWLLEHGPSVGVDPSLIMLMGESAGANLAAAAALVLRDEGVNLRSQVLIHPLLDATLDSQWARDFPPVGLSRSDCQHLLSAYVGGQHETLRDPLVSPLFADSLEGLPPALIISAEADVLRDDSRLYAERLQAAGVETKWTNYLAATHGFVVLDRVFRAGRQAQREIAREVRARLGT